MTTMLPDEGGFGFQGKHGGARPYFRNIRVGSLRSAGMCIDFPRAYAHNGKNAIIVSMFDR